MKNSKDLPAFAKILTIILVIAFFSCDKETLLPDETTSRNATTLSKDGQDKIKYSNKGHLPFFNADNFPEIPVIDNTYYPLETGKTYVYHAFEAEDDEEILETIEVYRTGDTKEVNGINTIVQKDQVWEGEYDKLIEDTDDWLAQDNDGNLWYLGEYSCSYEESPVCDDEGSWEAGVDGALAGYWMPVNPNEGMKYYLEFLKHEAEDQAVVVATGVTVTIDYGTFDNCLITKDYTRLEPGEYELKYYAPGIGLIKEEKYEHNEFTEYVVLVEIVN